MFAMRKYEGSSLSSIVFSYELIQRSLIKESLIRYNSSHIYPYFQAQNTNSPHQSQSGIQGNLQNVRSLAIYYISITYNNMEKTIIILLPFGIFFFPFSPSFSFFCRLVRESQKHYNVDFFVWDWDRLSRDGNYYIPFRQQQQQRYLIIIITITTPLLLLQSF